MAEARFRLNAPGDFYVQDGRCITCMTPHAVAPSLMGFHSTSRSDSHCYFARQPQTAEEVAAAVSAVTHSCCAALRYAGKDPAVLQALADLGAAESCDALTERGEG